jgi:L-fuconolactonase
LRFEASLTMSEIAIVDSHVHLWNPTQFRYPWLDAFPSLNRPFLPEDFATARRTNRVEKFIFVECGREASQNLAEVDWVSRFAKSEPHLKAVVAHANVERGRDVRAELEALAQYPLVKGIRRNVQGENESEFCLTSEFVKGVELLAEFNFTFDLCIKHHQLRPAAKLVKRVPQVTFVLDHCGKPDVHGGTIEPWASDLRRLAELPNVVCKISGLATEGDWSTWQIPDVENYLRLAVKFFGFKRVMFGGDWPYATLATAYQRWIETVKIVFAAASATETQQLFQTNAERIYRV